MGLYTSINKLCFTTILGAFERKVKGVPSHPQAQEHRDGGNCGEKKLLGKIS